MDGTTPYDADEVYLPQNVGGGFESVERKIRGKLM